MSLWIRKLPTRRWARSRKILTKLLLPLLFSAFGLKSRSRFRKERASAGQFTLAAAALLVAGGAVLAQAPAPSITFTSVPALGSNDDLTGQTENVAPAGHRVAVYIFTAGGWWNKPTFAAPQTVIQPDGSWTCDITTGGADAAATKIAGFLIPQSYAPPLLAGAATLPAELDANALAKACADRDNTNSLHFSGYDWTIKTSAGAFVGPGPNLFSGSTDNVWVDPGGKLHLRITFRDGNWQCAEIVSMKSFGYGTYRFFIDSAVDALDANVVLGLFTWSDDPAFAHREIDVEMARWGNAADPTNAQYVVQPYGTPGNLTRFTVPSAGATTHSFQWTQGLVEFVSHFGAYAPPPAMPPPITQWVYAGPGVPPPGDENVRLNLWLFGGTPPTDSQEVEVVVSRFVFVPFPVPAPVIDSVTRATSGDVTLDCTGVPQLLYRFECSTDAVSWTTLDSQTADEPGFSFHDPNLAAPPFKLYRVFVPAQ